MSAGLTQKLQRLDDFLLSGAVGDDAMLLSELDGFLTGLIVGPDMIMPSEWLPVVWGGEAPVFESERQAQAVIGLIMGHYNDIVRQLDRNRYSPIYDIDNDDSIFWETWIEGFWEAMVLRPDGWLDIGATAALCAPVYDRLVNSGGPVEIHRYPNAYHLFDDPRNIQRGGRVTGGYDSQATELAWQRTMTFLRTRLDLPPPGNP